MTSEKAVFLFFYDFEMSNLGRGPATIKTQKQKLSQLLKTSCAERERERDFSGVREGAADVAFFASHQCTENQTAKQENLSGFFVNW